MLVPSIFQTALTDEFRDEFFREHSRMVPPQFMRCDILDDGENYRLEMELPGYRKTDIHAELADGYLTIHAHHQDNIEDQEHPLTYVRRERYAGDGKRSFYVGTYLKETDITANFDNGILILVFPKEDHVRQIEDRRFITIN